MKEAALEIIFDDEDEPTNPSIDPFDLNDVDDQTIGVAANMQLDKQLECIDANSNTNINRQLEDAWGIYFDPNRSHLLLSEDDLLAMLVSVDTSITTLRVINADYYIMTLDSLSSLRSAIDLLLRARNTYTETMSGYKEALNAAA